MDHVWLQPCLSLQQSMHPHEQCMSQCRDSVLGTAAIPLSCMLWCILLQPPTTANVHHATMSNQNAAHGQSMHPHPHAHVHMHTRTQSWCRTPLHL